MVRGLKRLEIPGLDHEEFISVMHCACAFGIVLNNRRMLGASSNINLRINLNTFALEQSWSNNFINPALLENTGSPISIQIKRSLCLFSIDANPGASQNYKLMLLKILDCYARFTYCVCHRILSKSRLPKRPFRLSLPFALSHHCPTGSTIAHTRTAPREPVKICPKFLKTTPPRCSHHPPDKRARCCACVGQREREENTPRKAN